MFEGTIDAASVYPREVVKRALHHNAAALILAHNHPSGVAEPSQADRQITQINRCIGAGGHPNSPTILSLEMAKLSLLHQSVDGFESHFRLLVALNLLSFRPHFRTLNQL